MVRWTPDLIARAIGILGQHVQFDAALRAMTHEFGFLVTRDALGGALARGGFRSPFTYLRREAPRQYDTQPGMPAIRPEEFASNDFAAQPAPPIESSTSVYRSALPDDRFEGLVELVRKRTKKGGIDLETICDELGLTPREARELIEDARSHGVSIDVAHDRLHLKLPEPSPNAAPVDVAPAADASHHRIGVFSDLHYGSKYCLRTQHADFIRQCYDEGIRDFFCPGDVVEGCYKHAQWELSCVSQEDQQNEFLDSVPELPGMRIFFIDGNHDYTWTDRTGVESGRSLVRLASDRGRHDLFFLGSRGALINYGGTKIELWHPKKGNAYALSYQLQNKIRDTAPERLPHILLTGHTHQYVKLRRSNVWALYSATFQHGDAPYGRSLGGDVTMGGIILDWTLDSDGQVRRLSDTLVLAQHTPKTFDVAI